MKCLLASGYSHLSLVSPFQVQLPTDRSSVYEVKLVVCDRVIERLKNCQPAHRYILFDNGTSVNTTDKPMRIQGQVAKAELLWVTTSREGVELQWNGHFQNEEFVRKGLLNAIKTEPGIYDGTYEHYKGNWEAKDCMMAKLLAYDNLTWLTNHSL